MSSVMPIQYERLAVMCLASAAIFISTGFFRLTDKIATVQVFLAVREKEKEPIRTIKGAVYGRLPRYSIDRLAEITRR